MGIFVVQVIIKPINNLVKNAERMTTSNDVELIPKSDKKGVRTPDIIMDGLKWEMKSPKGKGRWLLENTLKKAVRQSPNIIIDLDRIKIHQTKCLQELEKQFYKSKGVRWLKIVTKTKKIVEFKK